MGGGGGVHLVLRGVRNILGNLMGGSEINNPWSRGGRGIIYLFKAYEGFQNSVLI